MRTVTNVHRRRLQAVFNDKALVVNHRLLGPDTLTQHTWSNAASSVKGRAEMCCDSTASPGTLVDSVRPLLHMTTSRLEFTVTGMRVYVGTGWLGDKAQALTHECWNGAFPEKQLQRGWRDAVRIPRITRNRHCGRCKRHLNPVNTLRSTRNYPCGQYWWPPSPVRTLGITPIG